MKNKFLSGLLILGILFVFGCTRIGQGSTYIPTTSSGSIDLPACVAKCTGSSQIWRMGCKTDWVLPNY